MSSADVQDAVVLTEGVEFADIVVGVGGPLTIDDESVSMATVREFEAQFENTE